jgi:stress-induced morphogen
LNQIKKALASYAAEHAAADVVLYRHGPYLIRIRIIDPDFAGVSRDERHETVWAYLEGLGDEVLSEVSLLLLLTPKETSKSFANVEFDNPVPSGL